MLACTIQTAWKDAMDGSSVFPSPLPIKIAPKCMPSEITKSKCAKVLGSLHPDFLISLSPLTIHAKIYAYHHLLLTIVYYFSSILHFKINNNFVII
jgi:hypothetical protein